MGEKISALGQEENGPQIDLAERLGLRALTVSDIQRGDAFYLPEVESRCRIAKVVEGGVPGDERSHEELLGGVNRSESATPHLSRWNSPK